MMDIMMVDAIKAVFGLTFYDFFFLLLNVFLELLIFESFEEFFFKITHGFLMKLSD